MIVCLIVYINAFSISPSRSSWTTDHGVELILAYLVHFCALIRSHKGMPRRVWRRETPNATGESSMLAFQARPSDERTEPSR